MCDLHNIGPLAQVPSECRSKQVLYNVLKHRRAEVGDRLGLANKAGGGFFNKDGALNWKLGVYRMEFTEKKLSLIEHRPTKSKINIEDAVDVDDSFDLTNNHSDLSAEVSKGDCKARRFKLKDFFSKSEGPNLVPTWTGNASQFQELSTQVADEIAQNKKDSSVSEQNAKKVVVALESRAKEKRMEATKKARAALMQRQQECQKRRTVSLATT